MNNSASPKKPRVVEGKPNFFKKKFFRFLQLLKYFILSSIILTMLEIGVAYWLISSRWHLLLSKEQMQKFAAQVSEEPPLPDNFMRVYTAIYPRHVNTTLTQQVFINYGTRFLLRHTELERKPHCFCDMVYDLQKPEHPELDHLEWDGRLQDLEFGFGIEKYTSPKQCFYYVFRRKIDEVIHRLNRDQYPYLIEKPLEQLNEDELIELILLLKERAKFTRFKNPGRFEQAFNDYKRRVEIAKKTPA
jgi:hypothetical protein